MKTHGSYAMINSMDDSPFLIVGGGIAGLAASLGLSNIGRSSHVLERSPTFEALGAGIQLGPNAVRALQHLGAWEAVSPHCTSPKEIHIFDGLSGKMLLRVPLGATFETRFRAPYRVALRSDLQKALLATANARQNIKIQCSAEVTGLSFAETTLTLASGELVTGQAIIGADGVHSNVRKIMHGRNGYAKTRHTLFRALIPSAAVSKKLETEVVTLWLCPGGHVVHYAVDGGKFLNIVASVGNYGAGALQTFRNVCEPLSEIFAMQREWSQWEGFEVESKSIWSRQHTVLIGDAAHGSLPYLAQGAAMALEDACELSLAINRRAELPEAFMAFMRGRSSRTRNVQKISGQLGRIYHANSPLRIVRNALLRLTSPTKFLDHLAWLYNWNCSKWK
jgi:salicylate hydroxylase